MGMIEAQQGSVKVLGVDPRQDAIEMKRRVGYVSVARLSNLPLCATGLCLGAT